MLTIVSSAIQLVLVLFSLYLVLFQRYKRYNLLPGFDRKSQESYFLSPERLLELKFCPSKMSTLAFQPLFLEALKFGNCLTEENNVLEKGPLTLESFCFLSTMELQDNYSVFLKLLSDFLASQGIHWKQKCPLETSGHIVKSL